MKQLFTATFLLISLSAFCQLTSEQRLQDSIIGWDPKNYYDRNYKPQTSAVGRQKEAYVNKFAEWIKASYTPVGGLGEYQRFISPIGCSVAFSVWDVAFDHLDAERHFRPIGETGYPRFYIATNTLAGTWQIDFMSRSDEWYFTMQPNGYAPNDTEKKKRADADPKISPSASPFVTWRNDWYAVYLAPGNRLPINPVTKGEFLQAAMNRMDYLQDSLVREDLAKEYRKDDATRQKIVDARKTEIDRYRDNVRELLAKYASRAGEPAEVPNRQFTYHDLINGSWDVFTRGPNTIYYPVYKIEASTIREMAEARPVWVSVLFPFQTKNDGNKFYEMYRSMTENVNYQYIHDYFFNPEKVKGVAYSPLNKETLEQRLASYRSRNAHNLSAPVKTDDAGGGFFTENFSRTAEGGEPQDWFFYRPGSTAFTVSTIAGESGKWLKLGKGRSIKPTLLKSPLPANFSLEYDVATDKGFTSRSGGACELTITNRKVLANNDVTGMSSDPHSANITIRTEAGSESDFNNNNYRGVLRVTISNTPEANEENFVKGITATYPLKEFTDSKSKVHIRFAVTNGDVSVAVNDRVVIGPGDFKMTYGGACKLCGVPAGLQFRSFLLNNVTDSRSDASVYVSNIRLLKK